MISSKGLRWILAALLALASTSAISHPMKGVGLKRDNPEGAALVHQLHADWYYNWSSSPDSGISDVEYVPMLWGLDNARTAAWPAGTRTLLLFNEPDFAKQSNIAPNQAIAAVQRLTPKLGGMRLGSPAPAHADGPWLPKFMAMAQRNNVQIDFVTIHWYGKPDVQKFLHTLDAVHARYGKPVWITEFAVADWQAKKHGYNRYTPEQVATFMRGAIAGIKARPYVERYVWFSTQDPDNLTVRSSRLWDRQGQLTPLGAIYASE